VTLCVAGDNNASVLTSTTPTASAWSSVAASLSDNNSLGPVDGLSCPSVSLCVAGFYEVESDADLDGTLIASSGKPTVAGSWSSSGIFIDGGVNGGPGGGEGVVDGIACPSTAQCVAVDDAGRILASTNPTEYQSWKSDRVDARIHLNGISCPSTRLCVAIDRAGNVVSATKPIGGHWRVAHVDGKNALISISCPSTRLCVAVDGAKHVLTSTNPAGGAHAWKRTSTVDGNLTTVSCPSVSLCLAGDSDGQLIVGRRASREARGRRGGS
jgi:hypothetical protein